MVAHGFPPAGHGSTTTTSTRHVVLTANSSSVHAPSLRPPTRDRYEEARSPTVLPGRVDDAVGSIADRCSTSPLTTTYIRPSSSSSRDVSSSKPNSRNGRGDATDAGLIVDANAGPSGRAVAATLVVLADPPFRSARSRPQTPRRDGMSASFFAEPHYGSDRGRSSDEVHPQLEVDDGDTSVERASPPSTNTGVTLAGLVDRLLAPPTSKADTNFFLIFLCLYRMFAAPGQVLEIVLARFRDASDGDDRTTAQLRILGVLAQWIGSYPGDFAHPWTRRHLSHLVAGLPNTRQFAGAAKDLRAALDVYVNDDDAIWARSDAAWLPESAAWNADQGLEELDESMREMTASGEDAGGVNSTRVSGAPSQTSSGENSTTLSGGSSQTLVNAVDAAEREAQALVPIPRTRLSKILWRQFMDCPADDFAEEMTRIDWIMFAAIRPRDIVRHIRLSSAQREKTKCVENVNRMIHQFNHLACWVANVILLRDKPKHRAQALERFMEIAWVSL